MNEFYSTLQQCPLFDGIREEDLGAMLSCLGARKMNFKKDQLIFREGEAATQVGLVLTGSVQLIREDYYGNRSIVAHISPTELFGESYACAGITHLPISVLSNEDCQVLLIDCRRITVSCTNACAFHSRVIFNLLQIVANKNLLFDQKILITSKRSTREKLMTYLLHQAKLQHSNTFTIPYNRQALADYLEVDRSGLSVEISKLRRDGILTSEKNSFTLL